MKTKPVEAVRESRPFVLPPKTERALTRMGCGPLIRKLKAAASGKITPEARADVRARRELHAIFDSTHRKLDGELVGRVTARLLDTVDYASKLSLRLREITRIKGRAKAGQLRSVLGLIHDVDLWLLRREVEGLRRDIPRLFKELGGDPSEELTLPGMVQIEALRPKKPLANPKSKT